MRIPPLILALFCALTAAGCTDPTRSPGSDDDDSATDDDDAAADDDDSAADDDDSAIDDDDATADDDDATADDDDATADDDDSAASGCPPQLEAALQDLADWSLVISCGRAWLAVAPADEQLRLAISWDLQNLSLGVGDSWLYTPWLVTPPNVVPGSFVVQEGSDLLAYDCSDVIENEPVVDRSWTAVDGTAALTIDTYDAEWSFSSTVQLGSVVIQADDDPALSCPVPDVVWSGLSMGWLPG